MSSKKKKLPEGFIWRNDIIHINKRYRGHRIRGSTYTQDIDVAQEVLSARIKAIHNKLTFGIQEEYIFKQAAIEYLKQIELERNYNPDAYRTIGDMKRELRLAVSYVGDLSIAMIHDACPEIKQMIEDRKRDGVRNKTVNDCLDMINRVLNRVKKWRREDGSPWAKNVTTLTLLPRSDASKAYPLTWEEVERLKAGFSKKSILPDMIDFLVHTGTRENEVCSLRWEWEYYIPELKVSVFCVPSTKVKNKVERFIILNKTASAVIEKYRGVDNTFVFVHQHGRNKGRPVYKVRNQSWVEAWRKAGLPVDKNMLKGVHNLKHTFGRRLSAIGCPWHERKILLGHKVGDVTEIYSPAQIEQLLKWACKVEDERKEMTVIKKLRLVNS